MLEVKVNKEIRDYTESMFFGLSLRQFVFSCLACIAAVSSYFLLKDILGSELTSWVCVLTALPFAILGFAKYNGMPAEKIIIAFIQSELITNKNLVMGENCYIYAKPGRKDNRQTYKNDNQHLYECQKKRRKWLWQ